VPGGADLGLLDLGLMPTAWTPSWVRGIGSRRGENSACCPARCLFAIAIRAPELWLAGRGPRAIWIPSPEAAVQQRVTGKPWPAARHLVSIAHRLGPPAATEGGRADHGPSTTGSGSESEASTERRGCSRPGVTVRSLVTEQFRQQGAAPGWAGGKGRRMGSPAVSDSG